MEQKQWIKSRTIQSVLVMAVLVLLQMFGGDGEMSDTIDKMGDLAGNHKDLLIQLGTLFAGGAAIHGRIRAKTELTPIKKKKEAESEND